MFASYDVHGDVVFAFSCLIGASPEWNLELEKFDLQ
jgi:hypothetical protein